MTDQLQSFIFDHADVRGRIVRLNKSIHTIMEQHDYPEIIRTILGELLTGAVLLSSSFKYQGQLTIQFQHESALKMLVAKCNHDLEIRGLAQWDDAAKAEELQHAFFSGKLIITLENNRDSNHYQSIIDIDHKTIAQAIEQYFEQSEQVPTKIVIAYDKQQFFGFFLQKMPSHSIEQLNFWQHIEVLTHTLKSEELIKWNNQLLLENLFHEEDIRLFSPQTFTFKCICNEEKCKNTLRLLGQKETIEYFLTNKILSVTCDYCSQSYEFTQSQAEQLFH